MEKKFKNFFTKIYTKFMKLFKKKEQDTLKKIEELNYPSHLVEGYIPQLLFAKEPFTHKYRKAEGDNLKYNIKKMWRFEDETRLLIESNTLHLWEMDLYKYPEDKALVQSVKKQWEIVNNLQTVKKSIEDLCETKTWDNLKDDLSSIFGKDTVDNYCDMYGMGENTEEITVGSEV